MTFFSKYVFFRKTRDLRNKPQEMTVILDSPFPFQMFLMNVERIRTYYSIFFAATRMEMDDVSFIHFSRNQKSDGTISFNSVLSRQQDSEQKRNGLKMDVLKRN